MNPSYGDSNNSASGRARVPGSDSADGNYQPYDPYRDTPSPATGRASVGGGVTGPEQGSGALGRASVPGAGATGRASVGRASVGRPDVITGPGGGPDGPD